VPQAASSQTKTLRRVQKTQQIHYELMLRAQCKLFTRIAEALLFPRRAIILNAPSTPPNTN